MTSDLGFMKAETGIDQDIKTFAKEGLIADLLLLILFFNNFLILKLFSIQHYFCLAFICVSCFKVNAG